VKAYKDSDGTIKSPVSNIHRYLEERRKKWRKIAGEDTCVEFSDLKGILL